MLKSITQFGESLYGKITLVFLAFLIVLYMFQIFLIPQIAKYFYTENTQAKNCDLAELLINSEEIIKRDSLDVEKLDTLFSYTHMIRPDVDIYILNTKGKILKSNRSLAMLEMQAIDIRHIHRFLEVKSINGFGNTCVFGPDPLHADNKMVFSAAKLLDEGELAGYAYVLLGKPVDFSTMEFITNSEAVRYGVILLSIVFGLIFCIGLFFFRSVVKGLRHITDTVVKFNTGDKTARVDYKTTGEIKQLSASFNEMADNLVKQFDKLLISEQERKDLVANISHDLKTPLSVIRGYADTLLLKKDEIDADEAHTFLQVIADESARVDRMVNDLFDLSKLNDDLHPLKAEPLLIGELIQDNLMKKRLYYPDTYIKIDLKVGDSIPHVLADVSMIDRVIRNLIDNAFKYSYGDHLIRIKLNSVDGMVHFSITNAILYDSIQDVEVLFHRYYRVPHTRPHSANQVEGTGLGLSIVRRILELHNSVINAKIIDKQFIVFSFALPIYNAH